MGSHSNNNQVMSFHRDMKTLFGDFSVKEHFQNAILQSLAQFLCDSCIGFLRHLYDDCASTRNYLSDACSILPLQYIIVRCLFYIYRLRTSC